MDGQLPTCRPGREAGQTRILSVAQERAICKISVTSALRRYRHCFDEPYPAIEAQAKARSGEIHCADETALVTTEVRLELRVLPQNPLV